MQLTVVGIINTIGKAAIGSDGQATLDKSGNEVDRSESTHIVQW